VSEKDPLRKLPADSAACSEHQEAQDTAQVIVATAQVQRREWKLLVSTFRCGISCSYDLRDFRPASDTRGTLRAKSEYRNIRIKSIPRSFS
jgi:hypothetical protein